MRNQRTLDSLYHSVYGDPDFERYDDDEELYHHGVLGMSWGKRHGPPYPLDGVDKKIARAEAKRKREKERKMKKLQKAAKKARKLKAKKQKIAEKGDMDKIRKNADLFSNEELAYLMERDAMKRGLGGEKERSADEKFELAMKRMGQIADVASKGAQVFSALKQGAEMVSAFHDVKVKELTKEGKHLENVSKEFDIRFKRDPTEAYNYLDKELGRKYASDKDTKEGKLEEKAERKEREVGAKARIEQAKLDEKDLKKAQKAMKDQDKAEKKEKRQQTFDKLFGKNKSKSIQERSVVTIGHQDTDIGKDFVQNFEFPKWYVQEFQNSVSGKAAANNSANRATVSSIPQQSISTGKKYVSTVFNSDTLPYVSSFRKDNSKKYTMSTTSTRGVMSPEMERRGNSGHIKASIVKARNRGSGSSMRYSDFWDQFVNFK